MKSVLDKFKREDLPNDGLKELSDVIGINSVKAVMVKMPGVTVHVPKSIYKQSDMNYIRNNRDKSVSEMARELGCSHRTVYRKLKKVFREKKII
jgi:transcriptional regulator of acetoin/glycerol metabolism